VPLRPTDVKVPEKEKPQSGLQAEESVSGHGENVALCALPLTVPEGVVTLRKICE
jgi:hypothetical protein